MNLFRQAGIFSLLLAVAGCGTFRSKPAPVGFTLSEKDRQQSVALSLYGSGLLHEGMEGGRSAVALSNFLAAAAAAPDLPKLQIKAAMACLQNGRFEDAIRILQDNARLQPTSADAWLHLAVACHYTGRRKDAVAHYRHALKLAPDRASLYLNLAGILWEDGLHQDALDVIRTGFTRATDKDTLHDACITKAQNLAANGNIDAAIECFDLLANQSHQRRSFYQFLVGSLHAESGRTRKALDYFRRATEGDDPHPDAFLWMATILATTDPAKAVAVLTSGIRHFPDNLEMRYLKASLHEKLGQPALALQTLDATATNSPATAESAVRVALIQLKIDRPAAMSTLEEANRRMPDKPAILYPLAALLLAENRYDEAATLFTRTLSLMKASGQQVGENLYFSCGAACERAGRLKEAEQAFLECIENYPTHHESLNYLAYTWAEQGTNLDQAAEFATRAVVAEPDNPAYLDTLGWIYYRQKKYPEALDQMESAFILCSDDPTIADHLGDVYMALGRQDDAVTQWSRSFVLDPDNPKVAGKLKAKGIPLDPLRAEARKRQSNAAPPKD
jgi:tetratricopeptide (TPR) repeat protein